MSTFKRFDPRAPLSSAKFYSAFANKVISKNIHQRIAQEFMIVVPGQRVLDIGCGPADILDFLPDIDYVGFDKSENYIRNAKQKHGERGQFNCQILSSEMASGLEKFDHVFALGLLHHLTDAEAAVLIDTAQNALKADGKFFTFDGAYTDNQSLVARWLLNKDRGNYVRTPEAYTALASAKFSSVEKVVRTDLLRIPYTHCIMTCSG